MALTPVTGGPVGPRQQFGSEGRKAAFIVTCSQKINHERLMFYFTLLSQRVVFNLRT